MIVKMITENAETVPAFVKKTIDFGNGIAFDITEPITGFRSCHDGVPAEGRIVFFCKRTQVNSHEESDETYVMKIKAQIPSEDRELSQAPHSGPSDTTTHELDALQAFTKSENPHVPHLVAFKTEIQGADGPFPGGYLSYTVMTRKPGKSLFDLKYYGLPEDEQANIRRRFLPALRSLFALGIEPMDRGMRNILWEPETQRLSIIDFELWREPFVTTIKDETKELQQWALVSRPPSISWWAEWKTQGW